MNNIFLVLNKGFEFLTPFVKKLLGSAVAVAGAVGDSIRKSNKRAKMHIRLIRIKNILEFISSVALLIATIIALICTIGEFFKKTR